MDKVRNFAFLFLFVISSILVSIGLIFISINLISQSPAAVESQLIASTIGIVGLLFIATKFDYRVLQKDLILKIIYGLAITLLILVFPLGTEINGARSWIKMGVFSFQPAEIAKFLLIIFVAAYLSKYEHELKDIKKLARFALLIFAPTILIFLEKDLGLVMLFLATVVTMLFVSKVPKRYLVVTTLLTFFIFVLGILIAPYRLKRLEAIIDPFKYAHTYGYQVIQALIAIARGGFKGVGIGNGIMKNYYLPEPFNDFIYASMSEELGFICMIFISILFFSLLVVSFRILETCEDKFAKYLIIGISISIVLQAFIHIAVNLSLLPTTGITLPFISKGGTSLIVMLFSVGLLMNIAKNSPLRISVKIKI